MAWPLSHCWSAFLSCTRWWLVLNLNSREKKRIRDIGRKKGTTRLPVAVRSNLTFMYSRMNNEWTESVYTFSHSSRFKNPKIEQNHTCDSSIDKPQDFYCVPGSRHSDVLKNPYLCDRIYVFFSFSFVWTAIKGAHKSIVFFPWCLVVHRNQETMNGATPCWALYLWSFFLVAILFVIRDIYLFFIISECRAQ